MGSRAKKSRDTRSSCEQIERMLAKGQYKDALKAAKVGYRDEPTDAARRLFDIASIERADQLRQDQLQPQCKEIVDELLKLGVRDAAARQRFAGLLLKLGRLDELSAPAGDPQSASDSQAQLAALVADHAVLDPQTAPAKFLHILAEALEVRGALESLEAGDETRMVESLRSIARSSPLADWKFFVRGLAAYYRHDEAELRANWERLDPHRAAARIAAPLLSLAGANGQSPRAGNTSAALSMLEQQLFGCDISQRLRQLQQCLLDCDGDRLVDIAPTQLAAIERAASAVAQRALQIIVTELIRHEQPSIIAALAQKVPGLPLDPHWHRAKALVAERGQYADFESAEEHWLEYLADLKQSTIPAADQRIVKALVWSHVGKLRCVEFADRWADGTDDDELDEQDADRRDVRAAFDNSLLAAPELPDSYREWAQLELAWDQPNQTAIVYRRMLAQFPDDFDALLFVGQRETHHGDPFQGRELLERARRLKPLDESLVGDVWANHLACARVFACRGAFDEARAEFALAKPLTKPEQRPQFDTRRAVMEHKAGDIKAGETLVAQAHAATDAPATVRMLLAIEANRYALPAATIGRFEKEWRAALKAACTSREAGMMSSFMLAFNRNKVEYPNRARHLRDLIAYLRRATKLKFDEQDLVLVFGLLIANQEPKLAKTFATKGHREFPDQPLFTYALARQEIDRGPHKCDRRRARQLLEQARDQVQQARNPSQDGLLEDINQSLELLGMATNPFAVPGPFGGPGPFGPGNLHFDEQIPGSEAEMVESVLEMARKMAARMGLNPDQAEEMLINGPLSKFFPGAMPPPTNPRRKK